MNRLDIQAWKDLFFKKRYRYYTAPDTINIIGIRTMNRHTNLFDDELVVIYNKDVDQASIYRFPITTRPGSITLRRPVNSRGTAILVPGQYHSYRLDLHNGKYLALCQRADMVKVYRDNNRNLVLDLNPKTIQEGYFGINIHKAG